MASSFARDECNQTSVVLSFFQKLPVYGRNVDDITEEINIPPKCYQDHLDCEHQCIAQNLQEILFLHRFYQHAAPYETFRFDADVQWLTLKTHFCVQQSGSNLKHNYLSIVFRWRLFGKQLGRWNVYCSTPGGLSRQDNCFLTSHNDNREVCQIQEVVICSWFLPLEKFCVGRCIHLPSKFHPCVFLSQTGFLFRVQKQLYQPWRRFLSKHHWRCKWHLKRIYVACVLLPPSLSLVSWFPPFFLFQDFLWKLESCILGGNPQATKLQPKEVNIFLRGFGSLIKDKCWGSGRQASGPTRESSSGVSWKVGQARDARNTIAEQPTCMRLLRWHLSLISKFHTFCALMNHQVGDPWSQMREKQSPRTPDVRWNSCLEMICFCRMESCVLCLSRFCSRPTWMKVDWLRLSCDVPCLDFTVRKLSLESLKNPQNEHRSSDLLFILFIIARSSE